MSSNGGEPADEPKQDDHTEPPEDEHAAAPAAGQPEQPFGEQPPRAAPAGATQQSIGDLLQEPDSKRWMKAIAGTMAVAGLGLGLLVFLLGAFGGQELTAGGTGSIDDAQYKLQLVSAVFQSAPYVGFAIASVAGLLVGFRMDASDRKRLVTAAAGGFIGLVALVMVAEILASTQAPSFGGQSYSLDYGQALINSVAMGVVAALISGGSAYFATDLEA